MYFAISIAVLAVPLFLCYEPSLNCNQRTVHLSWSIFE